MKLAFYENLAENIKNELWDAVWSDSFLAAQGHKIRRHLLYDGETAGPLSQRDEISLGTIGLKMVGDYACGNFS